LELPPKAISLTAIVSSIAAQALLIVKLSEKLALY